MTAHVSATWHPTLCCSLMPRVNMILVTITIQSPYFLWCHMSLLPLPHVTFREYHTTFWLLTFFLLFSYLGKWPKCDNSRIWCPFEKVNIWPESAWRDRCNGTGFILFWELSFLILFEPCQALGSNSRSHLPTKGPFGPQKVTKMDLDWLHTHNEKNKTQCCTKMML